MSVNVSSQQPAGQVKLGQWATLWQALIRPSDDLRDLAERRDAQLLANAMLIIIPVLMALVVTVLPIVQKQSYAELLSDPLFLGAVFLVTSLFIPYVLSRTRYYRLGVIYGSASISIFIFVLRFFGVTQAFADSTLFGFQVLSVMFAALFLSARGVVITGALNAVALLLFPFIVPNVAWSDIIIPASLIMEVTTFVAVAASHRSRVEADRRAQLEQTNAALRTTGEELRKATAFAQEANHMKDLFLATMSHELRTPLNAIIGFLGLMIYGGELGEDNAHMAMRAMANSNRLLSLINNILDLSRIASGRLEITPVRTRIKDLAHIIHQDMALQVKEKDLDFIVEIDDRLPEQIIHDEERITQIATNLVGNALKFTNQGSIRLVFARRDDRLIIEVADTGIGIPTAKQDIIFDEFTQVDMDSTRKHGGAGLGLSIVKRLAILMKGSAKVSSAPGQGSTFTVEIPLNLVSEPALEPLASGA